MKANLLDHTFHGKIEPVRNHETTLPTVALEGIEFTVFFIVIYFIFARFWISTNKEQEKVVTRPQHKGFGTLTHQ